MIKFPVVLLLITLLSGCAGNKLGKQTGQNANHSYFSDASECRDSATQKQKFNVPTAGTQTVVEIPAGYNAISFLDCMQHTGWPVPRADPTEYLEVSTTCLEKAQGTKNLDESYADCIKRSRLKVDIINDK